MLKSVIDIIKHLFRPYKYDKALIDAYTKHCERIEQSIEPAKNDYATKASRIA